MPPISAVATAARESARVQGRFGVQVKAEADLGSLPEAPPAMDLEQAMEWWFEDGSYNIATAAVDLVGGCGDDWEGWGPLEPDASEFKRGLVDESCAAASALLAAAERFDHPVSHGTGRMLDLAVGSVYRVPLLATSEDSETVDDFAQASSEDGVGEVWDFPSGACGVRLSCTATGAEWVITGDYRVADRHVDERGVPHTVFVPVDGQ